MLDTYLVLQIPLNDVWFPLLFLIVLLDPWILWVCVCLFFNQSVSDKCHRYMVKWNTNIFSYRPCSSPKHSSREGEKLQGRKEREEWDNKLERNHDCYPRDFPYGTSTDNGERGQIQLKKKITSFKKRPWNPHMGNNIVSDEKTNIVHEIKTVWEALQNTIM